MSVSGQTECPQDAQALKGQKGLTRIGRALGYSLAGWRAALRGGTSERVAQLVEQLTFNQ